MSGGATCDACGQMLPQPSRNHHITDRELDVLSAWWLLHSIRATARFFGTAEQTVKNQLQTARKRNGVHTSTELAQMFMARLRSMDELVTQHNTRPRMVA